MTRSFASFNRRTGQGLGEDWLLKIGKEGGRELKGNGDLN
jgi:hypothetical protein